MAEIEEGQPDGACDHEPEGDVRPGLGPLRDGPHDVEQGDEEDEGERHVEPPREAERLTPISETDRDDNDSSRHQGYEAEQAEASQRRAAQPGAGQAREHVIDATHQGEHQEPDHQDEVRHRLEAAEAHRGEVVEAEGEQGEHLEQATQGQESGSDQDVGCCDAVLVGGTPEEGSNVCRLAGRHQIPRSGTGRREHNDSTRSFRPAPEGGQAPERVLCRDPGYGRNGSTGTTRARSKNQMYRLAELSDSTRKKAGWGLLLIGTLLLVAGVIWLHYSSLPQTTVVDGEAVPVVVDYFNWIPRGAIWKGLAYLAIFGASQMMVIGGVFLWILNQRMTWSRALFAAFVTWLELVIIFGMVPSEWLSYAQTDLDWSSQRIALTIPPILVLGNTVEISYAVIKDSISMGYHLVMLGAAAVFALELQKMKQGRPASAAKPEKKSPYGRPLVRGET